MQVQQGHEFRQRVRLEDVLLGPEEWGIAVRMLMTLKDHLVTGRPFLLLSK